MRGQATIAGDIRAIAHLGAVREWSDGQLLARFTERGDEVAFEAIVRRHGRMVVSVCRGILGDADDADDATQAAFLTLARRAGSIRRTESVGPWLHGVARRVAGKARAQAARRRATERIAAERSRPTEADPAPIAPEGWSELHEEIGRLRDRDRAALVLCGLEGWTHQEAARQLGWPVGTVKVRLMRARAVLRDRLARRGWSAPLGLLLRASPSPPSRPASATITRLVAAARVDPGTVPGPVAALVAGNLTRRVVMLASRWTLASATTLAVVASIAGGRPSGPSPAVAQDPAPAIKAAEPPIDNSRYDHYVMATVGNLDPALPEGLRTREAIAYEDGSVKLWTVTPHRLLAGPLTQEGKVRQVRFLNDRGLLMSSSDRSIRFWNFGDGSAAGGLDGQTAPLAGNAYSERSGRLVTTDPDRRSVTVWDMADRKPIAVIGQEGRPRLIGPSLSDDGQVVALFRDDRSVDLVEVITGRVYATVRPPSAALDAVFTETQSGLGVDPESIHREDGPFWSRLKGLGPRPGEAIPKG